MNNTFEFRRFGRVFRYIWLTQPVLPYIVLLAAIPLIWLFLLRTAVSDDAYPVSDEPFLFFIAYFFGCSWLYAGLSYKEFSRAGSAHRFLLLPGSVLEKWLSKALLVSVVFPLIAWLSFNLAFYGFGMLSARMFAFRFQPIDWGSRDILPALFFLFLSIPVAFASGAVWKRFGILKGLVFVCVLFVLLYFVMETAFNRRGYAASTGVLFQQISLPFNDSNCLGSTCFYIQLFWAMAAYIPALLLLGSTYFFMKEKEV